MACWLWVPLLAPAAYQGDGLTPSPCPALCSIYSVRADDLVQPGTIGLNAIQRRVSGRPEKGSPSRLLALALLLQLLLQTGQLGSGAAAAPAVTPHLGAGPSAAHPRGHTSAACACSGNGT